MPDKNIKDGNGEVRDLFLEPGDGELEMKSLHDGRENGLQMVFENHIQQNITPCYI